MCLEKKTDVYEELMDIQEYLDNHSDLPTKERASLLCRKNELMELLAPSHLDMKL